MYKVGDYVECVDDYGRTSSVKNGNIYQIESLETIKDYIRLKGVDDNVVFSPERFKKLHKVKATRLARKMFPKAVDKGEWLYV